VDVFGPQRFLLQAKRYSNKVGIEPVRQLAFLHSHLRATKSCLATTATFTKGAWELAQQYQWQLELRDFDGLQEWIKYAAERRLWQGDA
jgi:restriction system protein